MTLGAADYSGRAVIVTGAGNGLGRAYAHELARRGAAVVVNDLGVASDGTGGSAAVADAVVAEIRAAGGTAVASTASVATTAGAESIVRCAREHFGRVDALINNAGILRDGAFEDIDDDDFDAVIDTHLRGAFALTRAVLPMMQAAGYGRVVFTSSGAGLFGRGWQAGYTAAKAAMIGLMHAAAIEGARHGVLANAVLPVASTRLAGAARPAGAAADDELLTRPELVTVRDRMAPEFVAPLVVHLASDACTVTQGVFSAVGGRYARVLLGVTAGWRSPSDAPPSAEEIAEHWAEVEDRAEYDLPRSVVEEMYLTAVRAGIPR